MNTTRLGWSAALMTIVASASMTSGCPNRLDERVSSVPPTAPAITDFGECGAPQAGDLLGHSLAFGFFNAGGRADFVAGAPGRDNDRGVACVYRGRADGVVDVFAILDASSAGAGFRDMGTGSAGRSRRATSTRTGSTTWSPALHRMTRSA